MKSAFWKMPVCRLDMPVSGKRSVSGHDDHYGNAFAGDGCLCKEKDTNAGRKDIVMSSEFSIDFSWESLKIEP